MRIIKTKFSLVFIFGELGRENVTKKWGGHMTHQLYGRFIL